MFATRALRQVAQHAERKPLIKFLGKRTHPSSIDHTPKPHPASPTHSLPDYFTSSSSSAKTPSSHSSFSSYRDHAQQHGPLRKAATTHGSGAGGEAVGIGGRAAAELGPIRVTTGGYADRYDLPQRYRWQALSEEEMEMVDSGGASLFA